MNRRQLLVGVAALGVARTASAGEGAARREYLREHRSWTRELVLYEDGSTALRMRATALEPAFRAILAAERQRLLAPDPENQAAFEARMAADGRDFVEFVFTADSAYANARKFGPGDDRWNLACAADGADQPLDAVDRVRRPSPLHDALYAQVDRWSDLWIARFRRATPSPRALVLHVGGGYGNGDLRWELA